MREMRRGLLGLGLALALAAGACGGSDAGEHRGHGIVRGVDAEARTVTIAHGAIPGLMKGMTMTFELAPEVAVEGIEPEVEVDFRVRHAEGRYTVTELRRAEP